MRFGTDAGEHQQLGRLEHSCAQNELISGRNSHFFSAVGNQNRAHSSTVFNNDSFCSGQFHNRDIRLSVEEYGASGSHAFVYSVHAFHKSSLLALAGYNTQVSRRLRHRHTDQCDMAGLLSSIAYFIDVLCQLFALANPCTCESAPKCLQFGHHVRYRYIQRAVSTCLCELWVVKFAIIVIVRRLLISSAKAPLILHFLRPYQSTPRNRSSSTLCHQMRPSRRMCHGCP